MRVGIVLLMQESNTFISGRTTLRHFADDLLAEGESVRERLAGSHHETGGFFEGLAAAGIEAVPVFAARALPFGVIDEETYAELIRRMHASLDAAGPLDGILAAPHGATVSAAVADVDGHFLGELRRRLPRPKPLIATLDPHANLSPAMVAACDAILPYRTNPHIDQKARGLQAADLMARTLRGEVRPVVAAAFPPLAINIEKQSHIDTPGRDLCAAADALQEHPGVISASVVWGFPYADVAEMGSALVAVADGDRALAQRTANELANTLWQRRQDFAGHFIAVDEAVKLAATLPGPVCLLDMGDNAGGGSPADGTFLAHALNIHPLVPSFVCFYDPEAAREAISAGVDHKIRLAMGGKSDDQHGPPLKAEVTLRGVFDGQFSEPEPRHGGFTTFDQGPTAVVETDHGLTIMLTSKRMAPFSLRQLTTFGIDPTRFKAIVAKGVHAPIAAYAAICPSKVRVNTPGSTSADMRRLTYHHRRRPMLPFEIDTTWSAG